MNDSEKIMERCLQLAAKGKPTARPNPLVGAVLVHEGRVLAEGFHEQYGKEHAEINCLNRVKDAERHLIPESTLYVSLEPCAHFGKTPPCALRLVQEKIKKVIICNTDPFEKVSGKGLEMLRNAGIGTETGLLEEKGRWLNRRFFCFYQDKRPYIILKWAQTGQGFFAPLNRTRFQMSNRHSQQLVHRWRTEEAAIMVGTETALRDDPQLTARLWNGPQPLRIVLDKKLRLPQNLRIFNEKAITWIINEIKDEEKENLRFVRMDFSKDLLPSILNKLFEAGILSLIVEGGERLLHSFLSENLWDEARIFETENVLKTGIPAPVLGNAQKVMETPLQSDRLRVFLNDSNPFRYVSGMEL